jgi:hypothetical protein
MNRLHPHPRVTAVAKNTTTAAPLALPQLSGRGIFRKTSSKDSRYVFASGLIRLNGLVLTSKFFAYFGNTTPVI